MPELLRSKIVRTRKEHQCFGCLEKFPAGTEMSAETNVNDGCVYTLHICLPCREYMDKYPEIADPYEGYTEGCVLEARREAGEENG